MPDKKDAKDAEPTQEERVAQMDAQVAANREFGHRSGGNTTEPGQYEQLSEEDLKKLEEAQTVEDVPTKTSAVPLADLPEDEEAKQEARVAAMDAQVAAGNPGSGPTAMATGVQGSAGTVEEPASEEKKAPARGAPKK